MSNASTTPNLSLIAGERKSRTMTAAERQAFERGRAEAERALLRERVGTPDYHPVPPIELSEAARKHWDQGLKAIPLVLRRPGIEDALCRYSLGMELIERSTAELELMGLLTTGRQGELVRNPLLIVRSSAFVQVREARRELGFPTSWVERSLRSKRK